MVHEIAHWIPFKMPFECFTLKYNTLWLLIQIHFNIGLFFLFFYLLLSIHIKKNKLWLDTQSINIWIGKLEYSTNTKQPGDL